MTPSEQLHLAASAYAHERVNGYKEALKKQGRRALTRDQSNGQWLAYYEGYIAGYEAKLKEGTDGVL